VVDCKTTIPTPHRDSRARLTVTDPKSYKDTVLLPQTDFSMRANAVKREPELQAFWEENKIYETLSQENPGEVYVLHDGPPYANGSLHLGHALNKVLKDIIVRSQQMMGKNSHYVPGWDCHGLPIEWKIEEKYRAKGRDKDAIPINEFRKECPNSPSIGSASSARNFAVSVSRATGGTRT